MIIYKQGLLSKSEQQIIENLLNECNDPFGDSYITRQNLRLFLRENSALLFEGLRKGDKLVYEENEGFIFVDGYSDKSPRKYLKILTKSEEATLRLLKALHWYVKEDIFCKIKKNNPIKDILERQGFRFAGDRGREILLCRQYIPTRPIVDKDREINAE